MDKKLTPKQKKAVTALLENRTNDDAAQAVGVTVRTLYRWMESSHFRQALTDAEGQAIDKAARRLVGLAGKALDALESVIDNPGQRGAAVKRLAAQAILDQLLKLRELRNIEERITRLERAL